MTKYLYFALAFLLPGCLLAGEGEKYKDFELNLIYGISERDIRVNHVKVPVVVGEVFGKHYNVPAQLGLDGTRSYIKLQPDIFTIAGQYIARDKAIRDNVTKCDLLDNNKQSIQNCGYTVLALIDGENNILTRFNTRKMPEMAMGSLLFTGWKQGYNAYGCYIGNPFSSADLDRDGKPELFFVGGIGAFGNDEGGKTIQTNLFIYNTVKKIKTLFKVELSYESFMIENVGLKSRHQSFTKNYIDKYGQSRSNDIHAGIRRYSKLYFKDFDKDDKLDILLWQREYISRLKSDPVEGYKLKNTIFKRFEETPTGFIEKSIDDKTAEKYMKDHGLTWRKGFPNKNHCSNTATDAPLIESYNEKYYGKVHNIYDPVLKK